MTTDEPGELHRRLGARLKDMILDGRWPAGTRLPASRALARDMGVARVTAARALRRLAEDGLIELHPRRGAVVAAHAGRAPAPPPRHAQSPRLPLALDGLAEELFQPALWRRCLVPPARVEAEAEAPALAQSIADMLAAQRGVQCRAGQICLATGTAHALRLAMDALAVSAPPTVADDGPALAADGVLLAHPAVHPVTGAALAEPSRRALLDWAAPPRRTLIEIDRDWDLVAPGAPRPAPLAARDAGVVHIGSFNRLLFPGLRIGYLVVPDWLMDKVRALPAEPSFGAPLLATLHAFLTGGSLAVHLRRRLADWRERRAWLLGRLSGLVAPEVNRRGPHLVLAPLGAGAGTVADAFARAGLAATALRTLPGHEHGPDRLLLGLTGTGPDMRHMVDLRLERALADWRRLER